MPDDAGAADVVIEVAALRDGELTAAAAGVVDAPDAMDALTPDRLTVIAVPRPRNALVLTAATTRPARKAGYRRCDGRVPGPAGCRGGGTDVDMPVSLRRGAEASPWQT